VDPGFYTTSWDVNLVARSSTPTANPENADGVTLPATRDDRRIDRPRVLWHYSHGTRSCRSPIQVRVAGRRLVDASSASSVDGAQCATGVAA
jgi:hypothetical protein